MLGFGYRTNECGFLGIRSVDASRPPSSMSSSIMTSSTHSQVQMRPRTSYTRKTRPASVHVTGVSTDQHVGSHDNSLVGKDGVLSRRSETPSSVKSAVSRKASNELRRPAGGSSQVASGKSSGKTSPSPMSQSVHETSTIKRQVKKKVSPSVSNGKEVVKGKVKTPEPVVEKVEVVKPEIIETQKDKVIENFESIESAFGTGSEDISYSSKTPDLFGRAMSADSNVTSEVLDKSGRDSASTNATLDESGGQEWSNPFITNVTPEPTANVHQEMGGGEGVGVKQVSPVPPEVKEEGGDDAGGKPKIMTEEEAKAALAEKRRLAREAVEREAARVAEVSWSAVGLC